MGQSPAGANEWLEVVGDVQATISSLECVHQQLLLVSRQVEQKGVRELRDTAHAVEGVAELAEQEGEGEWRDAAHVVEGVAKLVEQVEELDCLHTYLTWLSHISTLRYVLILLILGAPI